MGRIKSAIGAIAIAGMALSSSTVAASEEPATELYPSTNWNLDFAVDKCRLARAFGEGDDRHILVFEQGGPSDSFAFTAAGPRFDQFRHGREITVAFGAFPASKKVQPFTGRNDSFGSALIYSKLDFENRESQDSDDDGDELKAVLPMIDVEKAKQVEGLTIAKGKRRIEFKTGSIGPAMEALNTCAQDLVRDWGLDLDRHLTLTRLPLWINQADVVHSIQRYYPGRALRAGEQAIIRMRVNVDAEGNVTDCVLSDATETERLESPACREMRKAQFEPALDAEGIAMPSFYLTNIVYKMGGGNSARTGTRTR